MKLFAKIPQLYMLRPIVTFRYDHQQKGTKHLSGQLNLKPPHTYILLLVYARNHQRQQDLGSAVTLYVSEW